MKTKLFVLFSLYLTALQGTLYYAPELSQFFGAFSFQGVKADNPETSFYGLTDVPGAPLFIFDTDISAPSISFEGIYQFSVPKDLCFLGESLNILISDDYFWGNRKDTRFNDPESGTINLFGIDGSGFGGLVPGAEKSVFQLDQQQNELNLLFFKPVCLYSGFTLFPALGYCMIYRSFAPSSHLVNTVTGFDNGTIHEKLTTFYHGAKAEIALTKNFYGSWTGEIIPSFAYFAAHTTLVGRQSWGDNHLEEIHLKDTDERGCFQALLRIALLYQWNCLSVGGQIFGEYLSYVPGIFNPRQEEDLPTHITNKNGTVWGGGLFLGYFF